MEKEKSNLSLSHKIWSAIRYGSLIGLITAFPSFVTVFSKSNKTWNYVNDWTNKSIGFTSLVGAIYGWNKTKIEYLEQKSESLQNENNILKTELIDKESWVTRLQNVPQQRGTNISR